MKTIVVYFSRRGQNYSNGSIKNLEKGNAEIIAEMIAKNKEVAMFQIETVKDYPVDYTECTVVAKDEKKDNTRPEIKNNIPNFDEYENVILVYPNWWGTCPMAVFTFFDNHSMANKNIYPICTHEGSAMGSSESDLRNYCKDAVVHKGLAVQGTTVRNSESKIKEYIRGITE